MKRANFSKHTALASLAFASLVLTSLGTPSLAHAMSCRVVDQLSNPKLASNDKFWNEYAQLKDPTNEEALASLMRKHGHEPEGRFGSRADASTSSFQNTNQRAPSAAPQFTLSKQAIKDVGRLQPQVRAKLDVFLEAAKEGVRGVNKLHAAGGEWNLKKLNGKYDGDTSYSVRLNHAYRAIFHQKKDGSIEIFAVDKDTTH